MSDLPKKLNSQEIERKWGEFWDDAGTYAWDNSSDQDDIFKVDTPPPTVSGALHIGHVFSYTHTDVIARFQRMRGKSVFYPMGWDDNGLPTERRVQNIYAISCNPTVPYNPNWRPVARERKRSEYEDVSRQNFIDACSELTQKDEAAFELLWRQLGLSIDWSQQYTTIDSHCRATSQKSFISLYEKGLVYQTESPTVWDVDFQTAVSQAELEDREMPGAFHDIQFQVLNAPEGGLSSFVISTTRPELLPACIAVVAHPDDARFQSLFGQYAVTPLFGAKVPILPAEHADPEKGTGILMVCTFGDVNDVAWWTHSGLPLKHVIDRNGCFKPVNMADAPFLSQNPATAGQFYRELVGLRAKPARQIIVNRLKENDVLLNDPVPITHPVKFYEKGDAPIEFVTTRQWFIKILKHKEQFLAQGEKIQWHPPYMKARYDNWVNGLNQDWCISRQRFFGVPFPVWYPLDDAGQPIFTTPIIANLDQLPIDPQSQVPPGFDESQRNQPGGFIGDPDVMDTWATSSLTPQIISHWDQSPSRHRQLFPMDIRPQSHEIIRTWAFYTIVKSWMHHQEIPWRHITISGWILDPDRKKMSKSKGNVVTPTQLLNDYSSDAIRYWAAKARLGADTAYDESMFSIGKKLSNKIFNASKFVTMQVSGFPPFASDAISEPLDRAFCASFNQMASRATDALSRFDYAAALDVIESHFWMFCDHYIELVKGRAYRESDPVKKHSALATLALSLKTYIQLFAPFMPFVTEEIWSWRYSDLGSIHQSKWPAHPFGTINCNVNCFETAVTILTAIRAKKSQVNVSVKYPVQSLILRCPKDTQEISQNIQEDVCRAGNVECVTYANHDNMQIEVVLADLSSQI
jgi:valyl-tRNA synthetase